MGRTRFRLQMDGRTDGRQGDRYIPWTFRSGDKNGFTGESVIVLAAARTVTHKAAKTHRGGFFFNCALGWVCLTVHPHRNSNSVRFYNSFSLTQGHDIPIVNPIYPYTKYIRAMAFLMSTDLQGLDFPIVDPSSIRTLQPQISGPDIWNVSP